MKHAYTPPPPMHIPLSIPMIGMIVSMLLTLGHAFYTTGVVVNRLSVVEDNQRSASNKIDTLGSVNVELATVKATLNAISTQLLRMERQLDKKGLGE